MKEKKIRRITILLSILLHLLLLLLFQQAGKIDLLLAKPSEPEESPEERLVFELVETPEDALIEEPSENTNLASDKSTKARDLNEEELAQSDLPYSPGDFDLKEFPQPETQSQPDNQNNKPESEEREKGETQQLSEDPSNDRPEDNNNMLQPEEFKERLRQSLTYENLISSAADKGGISFNTYNWDFAPYLLAMKKRIESNWRPPFAFTHMGAISGTNQYRFRVKPDGKVVNLQQLNSDAHYSLDQASSGAISSSSPFLPLPADFPEEFLEVTITFSYIIRK